MDERDLFLYRHVDHVDECDLTIQHNLESESLELFLNKQTPTDLFLHKNSEQSDLFLGRPIDIGELFLEDGFSEDEEEFYRADTTIITADSILITADYHL